ncbi:MAG TPA: ABC transporter ATP-binding protein [Firmicutes bacterium]|nr:ABC transporter ATP-binding protein [Bacillales bacterium]HJA40115.1 ABC transporter ATP-binding protein [Bacillota bacterium]
MIHIQNIFFQRGRTPQINHISWDVYPGEHWCLLGRNGAGKTTLLNIITGYLFAQQGEIEVLGQIFGKANFTQLRKKIGIVSESIKQRFQPGQTTLDVVLSGKFASIDLYDMVSHEDICQAEKWLDFVDCLSIKTKSFGLLSQGEKQKILIARALMAEPALFILDEPCSGLDLLAREHILSYIEKIAMQKKAPTLIYVTHHIEEILPCFTHALLLREGKVFSKGTIDKQLTEQNLSAFFQHPVSVIQKDARRLVTLKKH